MILAMLPFDHAKKKLGGGGGVASYLSETKQFDWLIILQLNAWSLHVESTPSADLVSQ